MVIIHFGKPQKFILILSCSYLICKWVDIIMYPSPSSSSISKPNYEIDAIDLMANLSFVLRKTEKQKSLKSKGSSRGRGITKSV